MRGIPLNSSPAEFRAFGERVEAGKLLRYLEENEPSSAYDEEAHYQRDLADEAARLNYEAGLEHPEDEA